MFYNGQIVFSAKLKRPVVANTGKPPYKETHFIKEINGKYEVFLPQSIEEAKTLLSDCVISPAPLPDSHCPKCFNWKSNHPNFCYCDLSY